ncbi:MAG: aminotransferase class I/II-fold pyridoxal phosphate-dependent enzyme [Selenomonadaceae bacterium]|nr:aminotransferase class I/II-fold pyridoxal phosphate-dependent enzyme [Selenomonadaceae bacterium]
MQAIILAAGMGKRLKELTKDNTKCMVKVNGVTLIERMLHQLEQQHLSRIVIVVGYRGQKLIDYIETLNIQTPIVYVNNPVYDKTNNIYSLFLAKEYLCREDTLLLESDLIFEDAVLEELVNDPRETLALVDRYENWMDGTCIKVTSDDRIEKFISGKNFNFKDTADLYKTVNIYKFSKHFSENLYAPFLEAYSTALGNNEYYEQVLRVIMILDEPEIRAKRLNSLRSDNKFLRWYEIDDIQDLDIAESIFAPDDDEKVSMIQKRYGGYWRYPKLIDFCYLVNPYFPPQKLIDEINANSMKLLMQYPSGMRVNSLLAAKNFGVHIENILVGNGAAELIKLLMQKLSGKVGFVRPTFEEYPNRYDKAESICFSPQNENFSYNVDDLINFFGDKEITSLIVVNPDNPSGNFISKCDLIRLIHWTAKKNLNLIIDESFVDFADENETLIRQNILNANKHLCVIKSLSKSHGIGGLRLGVLASGNEELIAALKKDAAIWNINSFAEFYMQIFEKYKRVYFESLRKLREERKRFENELGKISGIRVIPSQANFIMIELVDKSARELCKNLLISYNIFVKDLSEKNSWKNYLRLAVRTTADNDKLLDALTKILSQEE